MGAVFPYLFNFIPLPFYVILFLLLVMLLVLCFMVLFYPFRSVMPPERSRWARTPSLRAIEVAAAAEPPQKN